MSGVRTGTKLQILRYVDFSHRPFMRSVIRLQCFEMFHCKQKEPGLNAAAAAHSHSSIAASPSSQPTAVRWSYKPFPHCQSFAYRLSVMLCCKQKEPGITAKAVSAACSSFVAPQPDTLLSAVRWSYKPFPILSIIRLQTLCDVML
jgi:hypothetical protein